MQLVVALQVFAHRHKQANFRPGVHAARPRHESSQQLGLRRRGNLSHFLDRALRTKLGVIKLLRALRVPVAEICGREAGQRFVFENQLPDLIFDVAVALKLIALRFSKLNF